MIELDERYSFSKVTNRFYLNKIMIQTNNFFFTLNIVLYSKESTRLGRYKLIL